jgi:hypothetical protein
MEAKGHERWDVTPTPSHPSIAAESVYRKFHLTWLEQKGN